MASRIGILILALALPVEAQSPPLREEALQALKKAATFYRTKLATHGGYVYFYNANDLKDRWGEGKADLETAFTQPPGTPTIGLAYVQAFEATGDPYYAECIAETARALVYGQLESGGWCQTIHWATPKKGQFGKYRKGKGGDWNMTSLDDGQTQTCLTFMAKADQALGFKNAEIHEAAEYGLNALLKGQFPIGAFPQGWRGPVDATKPASLKARYPEYDWRTEGIYKNYWECYTINDNMPGTVTTTLITAHQIYKDAKYKEALERFGNFLILAQMPDPQPGWCQQYNFEMLPIWARKFEPPAITAWESQDAMEALIKLHAYTGDKKYLEPLATALPYYKKCVLPDGRVARYYEFKTNKPLYQDAKYQLTYDDSSVPAHYGWKQSQRFDAIEKAYLQAKDGVTAPKARDAKELEDSVRKIVQSLDAEGRWVRIYKGEKYEGSPKFTMDFQFISSHDFRDNVAIMCEYIRATK